MPEVWTVNSAPSLVAYHKHVDRMYEEHKYVTFSPPRIGPDRSIDQNSLLHVWATEYVAYILKKDKRQVTKGELNGMKRIIKKKYTAAHPDSYKWMVYELVNPFNTSETKKDYTSSKSWKRGEMFLVLTWLQMTAAEDGLILEAKGAFKKNQRESNGE